MNSSKYILRFAPDIYQDENNETMLAIYNAQSKEFEKFEIEQQKAFLNNFVKHANVQGIRLFEAIFYIQADEINESLDFRRARIINKFTELPPFTRIFVEQMLENLFGTGKWEFDNYYNDYKVKIGIESNISGLVNETFKNLRQIIPANIIIEEIIYYPYLHGYLKRHYTHEEMKQFTHGDLNNG